jgi:hypothetical protein
MHNFKNYIATFCFLFASIITALAQAPQKMSYQSVIRNSEGTLLVSTLVGLKISVVKDGPTGTVVYEETQTNTTNENGLLSIEVGGGTPVLGTFSAINWATGIYYLKTETDPNGGSNYTISGVGQLLSVPYSLYASNSQNPGKSTIVLTGDITDSEAATQIATEFGNNTENLIIDNTTALTTVDLSMFKKLLELKVTENAALISLSLPQLKSIYNDCFIIGNPALTSIEFPLYSFVSKSLEIDNNSVLINISFPSLTKTRTSSGIGINNNLALQSVSFPQLLISNGSIAINGNQVLTSLDLGNMTNCFNIRVYSDVLTSFSMNSLVHVNSLEFILPSLTALNLSNLIDGQLNLNLEQMGNINLNAYSNGYLIISSNVMTSLSLPSYLNGDFNLTGPSLTTLDLPLFSSSNNLSIGATALTQLTFPALTTLDLIYVLGSPVLTSINFPSLTSAGQILISNNPQLSQVNLPVLNQINVVPGSTYLQFSDNALPSESINYLLNKLLNATPLNGKYIVLQNQNPPAPPTGQGILDKQALLDLGNSVTTD